MRPMRRVLPLLLLLIALPAAAQAPANVRAPVDDWWGWFVMEPEGHRLVRAYHFDHSGTAFDEDVTLRVEFDRDVGATYAPEIGSGTFTVNTPGSITKVTDGTWPGGFDAAQGNAWRFGGGYLSSSIAPPAGSFSGHLIYVPRRVGTLEYILGGWIQTTPNRGWMTYISASGAVSFILSANGSSAQATITCAAAWATKGRPFWLGFQLDCSAGVGSCVARCRVDELSAVTSSGLSPIYASAAGLSAGAGGAGANPMQGDLLYFEIADGAVWSADEFMRRRRARWGVLANDGLAGNSLDATDSTAGLPAVQICPAGTCEPHWQTSPRDTARVGSYAPGIGGVTTGGAQVNSIRDPDGLGCSAGEPGALWVQTETAGDGTAAVTCSTATAAHGIESWSLTTTGTTSVAELEGAGCRTELVGAPTYLRVQARKASGTCEWYIGLRTWSDNACADDEAYIWVAEGVDSTTTWAPLQGKVDLTSVGSWKPVIRQSGACEGYADSAELIEYGRGDVPSPVACLDCSTDADCSCTALVARFPWPLCTDFALRTRLSTWYSVEDLEDDAQNVYLSWLVYGLGGTVDNACSLQMDAHLDSLRCTCHEAALNLRWDTADAGLWDAGVEYTAECGHTQTGNGGLGRVYYSQDGIFYHNEDSSGTGSALMDACGEGHAWLGSNGTGTYANRGVTHDLWLFEGTDSWR